MGTVKIKHLVERNGSFYFQATPTMRQAGVFSEPLGHNRVKAIERAEFLNAEWDAARVGAKPKIAARGTINWLARDFQESEWYRVLKSVTQVEADFHLAIILNAPIAKFPAHAIARRHCRQFHNKLVQAKGRPNANKSMKWLRRLMSYAVEIGLRETNPALRMGLKHNPPREETWTVAEIEAFKRTAIEDGKRGWALAVHLGYDTSQRLSDILGLTWNDFDGEGLYFRQRKTGAKVYVALRAESLAMLAETKRRAVHIIVGDVWASRSGTTATSVGCFASCAPSRVFGLICDSTISGARPRPKFRPAAAPLKASLGIGPDLPPSSIMWCRARRHHARRNGCASPNREQKFERSTPSV